LTQEDCTYTALRQKIKLKWKFLLRQENYSVGSWRPYLRSLESSRSWQEFNARSLLSFSRSLFPCRVWLPEAHTNKDPAPRKLNNRTKHRFTSARVNAQTSEARSPCRSESNLATSRVLSVCQTPPELPQLLQESKQFICSPHDFEKSEFEPNVITN